MFLIAVSTVAGAAEKSAKASKTKPRAVATLAKNGAIVIHKEILVTTFRNGGTISDFKVVRLKDGYNLLRIGRSLSGILRTEVIRLREVSGSLVLPVDFKLEVIVSCLGSGSCSAVDDATGVSCTPANDKSGCQCGIPSDGCAMETSVEIYETKDFIR